MARRHKVKYKQPLQIQKYICTCLTICATQYMNSRIFMYTYVHVIKRISQRIETKKLFLRVFLYETHDENLQYNFQYTILF